MADFLFPLPPRTETDLQFQQALADSARDLSEDERYVLRRLASVVASMPDTTPHAGVLVTLPVFDFAVHAGLTSKVASRRLDVATHSIFERSIHLSRSDGTERTIRWAEACCADDDSFDLSFAEVFVRHLAMVLRPVPNDEVITSVGTIDGVDGSALLCQGTSQPHGLPVVLSSRLKSRTKRPKGMSMQRLLKRLSRRLKRSMNVDHRRDAVDIVAEDSPWRDKANRKYYKYTHRDLNVIHDWVVEKMEGR